MNITFNLELNSGSSSAGEKSVLIRCTQDRKHRRIGTGISVAVKAWNKSKQQIKKSHFMATEYNNVIKNKLKAVIVVYNKLLEVQNPVTLEELMTSLSHDTMVNFYEFANRTKMEEIKASNKLGTYKRYEAVLNKFKGFTGHSLDIKKVDYNLLRKYELYLLNTIKNSRDTVSSNLSVIRTIMNEAIRCNVYEKHNPFEQIHLKYTDNTKEKLTAEELQRIFNTPLPPIQSVLLARDFFLACFLAEGTRGGDMVAMQKDNIINKHLVFKQRKTGKQMSIPITEELEMIFNRYISDEPFIFPLLNKVKVVNEISINSKLTYINKYLKEVSKYCGIFKNLSSHVSRHTYTDLALKVSGGNIYQVQQSLGHESVKTTELYSKNRVNYDKVSLLPAIIELVNKEKTTL